MSIVRLRQTIAGETMFPPRAPFLLKVWRICRLVGEPSGFPTPPPLVRCADKALRAFPTPLHAHRPETGP